VAPLLHPGRWRAPRSRGTRASELLLQAALLPDARGLAAWQELRPSIDVVGLDGTAASLIPTLRRNLVALGVEDELFTVFKGVHRHSWARNQALLAGVVPLIAELEREGIPTMLLKGAALAAVAGADVGLRPLGDADVLVPTERRGDAIELLVAAGLSPTDGFPDWYVRDYLSELCPGWGFAGAGVIELDLHWHVLHISTEANADDDFWRAAVPLELGGVSTAGLCAADALLHTILHGLRWSAFAPHRWVLDATLIIDGAGGALDYDRLVEQARRRRAAPILRSGLLYLQRIVDAPVPAEPVRALAQRHRIIERLECRALVRRAPERSAFAQTLVHHRDYAQRAAPLGSRRSLASRLGTWASFFGVRRLRDLRQIAGGGPPGPGRPRSREAVALGHGTEASEDFRLELGRPLDLSVADWARTCVRYGAWLPETAVGCWLAGRAAQIVLALDERPAGSLLIGLDAGHPLAAHSRRVRLRLSANGHPVASFSATRDRPWLLGARARIPAEALTGATALELDFATPDALSPRRLGLSGDDRRLGFLLSSLVVHAPPRLTPGAPLEFADGGDGLRALSRGWSAPEAGGTWTDGPSASLVFALDGAAAQQIELTLETLAAHLPGRRPLGVEVRVGGERIALLRYGDAQPAARRIALDARHVDRHGELSLSLRIARPRSPHELGHSEDRRRLGLCLARVTMAA
jgi:hypothetical protein